MSHLSGFGVLSVLLVFSLFASAVMGMDGTPNPEKKVEGDAAPERIAERIRQLESESPEIRQEAAKRLEEMGEPALAALKEAATSVDPEVRNRALAIIRQIQDGPIRNRAGTVKQETGLPGILPDEVPPVPADYRLELFSGDRVLRFSRSADGVNGEILTRDGISRGTLRARDLDVVIRIILLLEQSKVNWAALEQNGRRSLRDRSSPDYSLRVVPSGRDSDLPVWSSTGQAKTWYWSRPERKEGFCAVIHTWGVRAILDLADVSLKPRPPDAALKKEVMDRLRAAGKTEETGILVDLAVEWKMSEAIPVLAGMGRDVEAHRIRIVTSADPRELLRDELCNADGVRQSWAFDHMKKACPPSVQHQLGRHVLQHEKSPQRVRDMLEHICALVVDPETVKTVRNLSIQPGLPEETLALALGALLRMTGEESVCTELLKLALKGPTDRGVLANAQRTAVNMLAEHASRGGQYADPVAEAIRTMLSRLPEKDDEFNAIYVLISRLGRIGRARDAEVIAKYFEHDNENVVSTAVSAMQGVDPKRALSEALKRIVQFVRAEAKDSCLFMKNLGEYLDLIWGMEARDALPLLLVLKNAIKCFTCGHAGVAKEERARLDALTRMLEARTPADRSKHALEFYRLSRRSLYHRTTSRFAKTLAAKLIAEGADPESLRELMP